MLSPALFHIFIEDLGQELIEVMDMNIDDVLLYAYGVLILCRSFHQLTKVIQFVDSWSKRNGMKLNKSKSAVGPLAPRNARTVPYLSKERNSTRQKIVWKIIVKNMLKIPIKTEYKT